MFLMTNRGVVTVTNTTITAGGTSQELQAKRMRSIISIQNTSDTDMWLNFGAAAAADTGIKITAGTTWTSPPNYCPTGSINVIGATTGKKFSWWWGK